MMGVINMNENKDKYTAIKKAIYDYCFEGKCHNTFRAKNIKQITGLSTRMIGRHFLPFLIKKGLVSVYSEGSHAKRYIIDRKKWENMSF